MSGRGRRKTCKLGQVCRSTGSCRRKPARSRSCRKNTVKRRRLCAAKRYKCRKRRVCKVGKMCRSTGKIRLPAKRKSTTPGGAPMIIL